MKMLLRYLRRFLPADSCRTGWNYSNNAPLPKRVGWAYSEDNSTHMFPVDESRYDD
jgi:hypothetical protein